MAVADYTAAMPLHARLVYEITRPDWHIFAAIQSHAFDYDFHPFSWDPTDGVYEIVMPTSIRGRACHKLLPLIRAIDDGSAALRRRFCARYWHQIHDDIPF